MKDNFKAQISEYKQLNKMAKKGEVVFMGSTFMHEFPFGELCRMLCTEEKIYNRSVSGLKTSDAIELYRQAVSPLKPRKLFINLGEEDGERGFIEDYRKLLKYIKEDSPITEILLFSIFSEDVSKRRINMEIEMLAKEQKIEYVDAMEGIIDRKGDIAEPFVDDDDQLTLTAYISFWRKIYYHLRRGNISYYDAFSISTAAMMV